jgi:hypothetical protein
MNIFVLHHSPAKSASMHVDKHVIKMPLEAAQMLCTAIRVTIGTKTTLIAPDGKKRVIYLLPDETYTWEKIIKKIDGEIMTKYKLILSSGLYVQSHINHPCNIWARENYYNFRWLYDYMVQLGYEYSYRYGKIHKSVTAMYENNVIDYAYDCLPHTKGMTPFVTAMPEQYIVPNDPINSYRNYYKYDKIKLHKWTNRDIPKFITGE